MRPAGDRSPYAEPGYRAARRRLERTPVECWKGCGRQASTLDHVPALAQHAHLEGTGCCELLPACARCNMAAGARLGNTRRRNTPSVQSRAW